MSEFVWLLPILVIMAGVLFLGFMANHWKEQARQEELEAQSRRRVLAEFAAIRQKRPEMIVGVSKWLMDEHDDR